MTTAMTTPLATPLAAGPGMVGVSAAFGTFGELLQGCLPERDGDFLVTLPIARWTAATFRAAPSPDGEVRVHPGHKHKARRLARMIVAESAPGLGGVLTVDSTLPEGKGMASSSADLVATARAVANAVGTPMPPKRIEALLRRIEPTDGVLYPGVVAFHHRAVRLRARLGSLPPLSIVAVDEGGMVDTIAFNRIPKPFTAADHREYQRLLDRVTLGLARRDLRAVGEVATRSAVMNQVLRPKRTLDAMIAIGEAYGGLGVVTAHSGTTVGILVDPATIGDRLAAIASACCELAGNVTVHRALTFPRWADPRRDATACSPRI